MRTLFPPASQDQRPGKAFAAASELRGSRTDFASGHFGPGPVAPEGGWGLGEPRTTLLLAKLLAGGRAKAPFHFLPLLLRLSYRGVVSDTGLEKSFVGKRKANFS